MSVSVFCMLFEVFIDIVIGLALSAHFQEPDYLDIIVFLIRIMDNTDRYEIKKESNIKILTILY